MTSFGRASLEIDYGLQHARAISQRLDASGMSGRVLVTGAEGFVGRHLCAQLATAGYEIIAGVGHMNSAIPGSRHFDLCEAASVERLVKDAGALTAVVHLAAITFVPDAERSPSSVMDVNLLGTIRLLDAIRRHAPAARALIVGSSEAYGPPQFLPVTESHALCPANPYAISKAAADHYGAYMHAAAGLDVVRARPFNHSGPGQADAFVLSSFAKQIAEIEAGRREPVLHVGNLDVARDFSHVTDVVKAYQGLLKDGRAGEAYNVCSGDSVRLSDVLDRFLALTSTRIEIQTDPERLRKVDILDVRGSHAKLTADTGWQPRIPFDQILRDLLDYWRGRLSR